MKTSLFFLKPQQLHRELINCLKWCLGTVYQISWLRCRRLRQSGLKMRHLGAWSWAEEWTRHTSGAHSFSLHETLDSRRDQPLRAQPTWIPNQTVCCQVTRFHRRANLWSIYSTQYYEMCPLLVNWPIWQDVTESSFHVTTCIVFFKRWMTWSCFQLPAELLSSLTNELDFVEDMCFSLVVTHFVHA